MPRTKNNGLQTEEVLFEVDAQVKKEFLDTLKKSTRIFYSYVLKLADEFEQTIGKSIYNFNIEERDELLLVKFKNRSAGAFKSNLTPLKKYVDFCIAPKNIVKHYENRFSAILTKDYEKYVNFQAMENAYTPKSVVRELEELLINEQDQLILELLSWGLRGRTEKENTLEDLTNLKVKDVNWDDKVLHLIDNDGQDRHIEVDDYTLDLIKKTINKGFYYFNNGLQKGKNEFGEYDKTEKGFQINETEYVFRVPGKNKSGKVNHQFFEGRMSRIKKWIEKPYITISSLYFSSIIDYAKKLKDEKGELTKDDYISINEIFAYGDDGEKYWYKTQDLINMYIGK